MQQSAETPTYQYTRIIKSWECVFRWLCLGNQRLGIRFISCRENGKHMKAEIRVSVNLDKYNNIVSFYNKEIGEV